MESTTLPPELTQQYEQEVSDESETIGEYKANKKRHLETAFKGFFVITNITLMVFVGYTVFKPEDDRFKGIEDAVALNTNSISEVTGSVKTNEETAKSFEDSLHNLKMYIEERSDQNNGKITLSSERVDQLELRLIEIEKQWIAIKESKKKSVVKTKPVAQRRAVIQPMSLVSIRSQGDYGLVNLASTKGEVSPLLRNGDEWNGWKFIRLDGRSAIFEVAGRERQLAL
ncbi:hypothetical protein [Marinagarivorans cellulosilyticus]|uniref:Uncharacterized protein n=1 Tax=Marinagarivorans cellulosilyticus TaxID=2721545 RepID=A0AAN1WHN6_9GAMM|nr:hypothetical protein [Marinagarivorans cellulosilyticus]BCD97767.1 hypothetical protein MARGE09_P1968 [Marinagarivorans cellulosilyticus]